MAFPRRRLLTKHFRELEFRRTEARAHLLKRHFETCQLRGIPGACESFYIRQDLEYGGSYGVGAQVLDIAPSGTVRTPRDVLKSLEICITRAIISNLKKDPFRTVRQHFVPSRFVQYLVEHDLMCRFPLATVQRMFSVDCSGSKK
ncbi:hypothetical protein MMB19_29565 (plasmid) [Ralstonia insidiosa]|nr:hypothetical protein MMB19_29565 [Ralstonia insidiosa]